ncbi:MAG: hypothetical protein ACOZQL_04785 [Myxococcota bacterium]
MAAIAHGSASVTEDVDVCVRFDEETVGRLARALSDLHPVERMSVQRRPVTDWSRFIGNRNLYLATDWGVLDLLGELSGLGAWERVAAHAVTLDLGPDLRVKVVGLSDLIASKRAVARPKDLRVARELENVLAKLEKP